MPSEVTDVAAISYYTGAICRTYPFFSTNLWQCASKAWVIYIEPYSGIASGILHILIVKTAVTLVTSTPQ